ncbi:hypothetical protein [Saccharopolyspora sp. NPDC002686]|uniref:DUF7340 domain-containing protein n=1 Tax=Saccharopolyspora sp. NPDC002686 TaxID=3154541 RepID=UPI00332E2D94
MTEDPRQLRHLQDQIRSVARELTATGERAVLRDDGTVTRHQVPSLLEQLRGATATGSEASRTGGGRGTPLPVSPAAVDLLTEIEQDAADLHIKALVHDRLTPEDRIRALVEIVGRWTDVRAVWTALGFLRRWTTQIQTLLDPPRQLHVAAACPACEARMVWRADPDTGEEVQTPALIVDGRIGCTCLACGHVWAPANLEHLAAVLGCAPPEE